jgi:hypothetical protein
MDQNEISRSEVIPRIYSSTEHHNRFIVPALSTEKDTIVIQSLLVVELDGRPIGAIRQIHLIEVISNVAQEIGKIHTTRVNRLNEHIPSRCTIVNLDQRQRQQPRRLRFSGGNRLTKHIYRLIVALLLAQHRTTLGQGSLAAY